MAEVKLREYKDAQRSKMVREGDDLKDFLDLTWDEDHSPIGKGSDVGGVTPGRNAATLDVMTPQELHLHNSASQTAHTSKLGSHHPAVHLFEDADVFEDYVFAEFRSSAASDIGNADLDVLGGEFGDLESQEVQFVCRAESPLKPPSKSYPTRPITASVGRPPISRAIHHPLMESTGRNNESLRKHPIGRRRPQTASGAVGVPTPARESIETPVLSPRLQPVTLGLLQAVSPPTRTMQ